jgi:hypothetical protein
MRRVQLKDKIKWKHFFLHSEAGLAALKTTAMM